MVVLCSIVCLPRPANASLRLSRSVLPRGSPPCSGKRRPSSVFCASAFFPRRPGCSARAARSGVVVHPREHANRARAQPRPAQEHRHANTLGHAMRARHRAHTRAGGACRVPRRAWCHARSFGSIRFDLVPRGLGTLVCAVALSARAIRIPATNAGGDGQLRAPGEAEAGINGDEAGDEMGDEARDERGPLSPWGGRVRG